MRNKTHIARDHARMLRKQMTGAQKYLWARLRILRKSHGMHVRRLAPIGPFITDFAILKVRLIVYIGVKDATRDRYLGAMGYHVLTVAELEIYQNTSAIVERIIHAAQNAQSHPVHLPHPVSLPHPSPPLKGRGRSAPDGPKGVPSPLGEGQGGGNKGQGIGFLGPKIK